VLVTATVVVVVAGWVDVVVVGAAVVEVVVAGWVEVVVVVGGAARVAGGGPPVVAASPHPVRRMPMRRTPAARAELTA